MASATDGACETRAAIGAPSAGAAASPMVVPFLGSGDAGQAVRNGAVASSCADLATLNGSTAEVLADDGEKKATGAAAAHPAVDSQPPSAVEACAPGTTEAHEGDPSQGGSSGTRDRRRAAAPDTIAPLTCAPSAGRSDGVTTYMHESQRRDGGAERDSAQPSDTDPRVAATGGGAPAQPRTGVAVDGSAYISIEDAAELRAALEGCHAVPEAEKALQLEPGGASAVIEKCASGTLQVADLMQLVRLLHPAEHTHVD